VYSGVPCVNMGDSPESGWIHLKVGKCTLSLEGGHKEFMEQSDLTHQAVFLN